MHQRNARATVETGLQMADLIAHPSKMYMLNSLGRVPYSQRSYGTRLAQVFRGKYNVYGQKLID